uniref:Uncharacterized protein n=1 Tax=Mycena chlorophos TaxID=658473 RepID=A0ABQ0L0R5_MYCCL|nr:predicted protein [Mycena chlorophos]
MLRAIAERGDAEKIAMALDIAMRYGMTDGDHHKAWAIDQIVRALTGCPAVNRSAIDSNGQAYDYETQGESEDYLAFVNKARDGEDGPNTYEWDEGVTP